MKAEMDKEKFLAARAANFDAAATAHKQQPACAGTKLPLWYRADSPVRPLHGEPDNGSCRGIRVIVTRGVQARG